MAITLRFEWDKNKNSKNIEKHGVAFQDALKVFFSEHVRIELDSDDELRFAAIGFMSKKLFTVIYTIRNNKFRLISARRSREDEERYYEKIFYHR